MTTPTLPIASLVRFAALALALATLPASLSGAAPPAPKPDVKAVDGEGLKKAISALKGKAVLVNLWATWCQPCVEEFPDLVKLANAYRSKGLVVAAISLDEPTDRPKVIAFIAQQKAAFPVFVRSKGDVEPFVAPLGRNWDGAVPTTYLIGRDGKPSGEPLAGGQSYAQFEAAVKKALK